MSGEGAVRLRSARPDEADRLRELAQETYSDYVELVGGRPRPLDSDYDALIADGRLTVAVRGGEVVGMVALEESEDGFWLDNLAVEPASQGTGIGRALLEHAEAAAVDAGYDSIRLFTHELMQDNLDLYARFGYVAETEPRADVPSFLVQLRKPLLR